MRHKMDKRRLGRKTGHRLAMLRNLTTSLFASRRIETTQARAEEVARFAEKLITLAKRAAASADRAAPEAERAARSLKDSKDKDEMKARLMSRAALSARRMVLRHIRDREVAGTLFDLAAAQYKDRKGGYTRTIKLGWRKGDGASMVLLELV